jgi:hypothetical protein
VDEGCIYGIPKSEAKLALVQIGCFSRGCRGNPYGIVSCTPSRKSLKKATEKNRNLLIFYGRGERI